MSYRVDIPTLSTNEVYTLTFEYEGTETIQLIVGDLTLETTDRRVVFTTTSPVNYIESNMNLTNLNIYEGYYESDDFGGEYTQESYIEGKSLINYKRRVDYGTLINNANIRETFTDDGYINYKQLGTGATGSGFRGNGFVSGIDQSKNYTIILRVRKNTFPTDVFVPFTLCHFNYGVKFDEAVKGGHWGISYNISGKQTGVWKAVVKGSGYNVSMSARYWGIIHSFLVDENSEVTDLTQRTDIVGCEIEYAIEVLQGDYFDIDTGIDGHFEGIGCVKSPRVISREQPLNMFYCTNWTSTLNNGTVTCQDGKFYFDGSFGGYTWFDIINGGKVKNNIYLEPGKYFAKVKAHSKEACVSNGMCISVEATMENGVTLDLCGVYTSKDNIYSGVTSAYKEFTSPIVKLTLKIWYGGNGSNNIIIDGIYISKTNIGDGLAFKENHVVSTPDDLELYNLPDGTCDTLDLTTGVVTRNTEFYKYTGTWGGAEECTVSGYDDGNWWFTRISTGFGTSKNTMILLHGIVFYQFIGITGQTHLLVPKSLVANASDMITWLRNNIFALIKKQTPTTEQLFLNPLKSYYNGSIQTSSQQLAPTLKTTLPISNKFTTTNLTSGSTYNVYFDGTATKLDAGGTIITNPVSPCEVECGGTTLTIEGTDIQNVRVIETTVKNEVGSVCETTDVELSGVKCIGGGIPNLLSTLSTDWENGTDYGVCIRYKYGIDVEPNEKYVFTVSNTRGLTYKEIAIWNTDKWVSNTESIITTQRLTANTPYILTVPSGVTKVYIYFPYDSSGNLNQAHEYELRMQEGTVDLGYGGQKEATIPLVCNLEQPIKLRSLGTTYDSYNPVTGELTKRIGVSETDGSYGVLSSPIASQVMKIETLTNVFPYLTNVVGDTTKIAVNSATYDEDNWVYFHNKKGSYQAINYLDMSNFKPNTDYTWFVEVKNNTLDGVLSLSMESATSVFDNTEIPVGFNGLFVLKKKTKADFTKLKRSFMVQKWYTVGGTIDFRITIVEGDYTRTTVPHFIGTQDVVFPINHPETPHLYTNGQVKVYSESDVYPTTILNGQSTNNYEVNELNKSNNYTIRYEGECESINLANKSNEQGTNRIVKSGATSGNLTFVNNSEDIDNVLLVQNDVREQEINHFTGLETVEVSKIIVQSPISKHLFYNHGLNDFVPSVNTNYSFDENNNLVLSNGYGNNVDTMLQTVDKYTLEKGDSVIFRVVGVENFAADHRLYVKLATQNFAFGGYSADTYVNFKAPKVKEIINEQGYCDVVYTYNSETITDNIQISNFFGKWIISSVVLCKQSQEIITPIIIDLPQPVQLNSLPDGTCDTYNPITGEYVQRVNGKPYSGDEKWNRGYTDLKCISYFLSLDRNRPDFNTSTYCTDLKVLKNSNIDEEGYFVAMGANHEPILTIRLKPETLSGISFKNWLQQSGLVIFHEIKPITTQLTPINIPTFEGGILQLITTDGKVFPMVEYSMPTNNRYDTSSWETGAVYTQRNMTEAYFNESTTPMTPTETMTLTTDHISSGSIILNDNGNGLIVLKGNYTGRDIPYFTGIRSVEAIEVETAPSPDQPLFGKGGRK